MKIKIVVLLIFIAISNLGCDSLSSDFKMSVEEVYELEGLVLNGVYIAGTIKSGCIANGDEYTVKRDGKTVIETIVRVFEVSGESGTEAAKGDYVKLYIPDVDKEDFQLGDIATSSVTSC